MPMPISEIACLATKREREFPFGWCVFACLCVAFMVWVVSSYYEARTYTHMTGKHVTTWEAMWIQLRVVGENQ